MAIAFRCWYCNRAYSRADTSVGNRFACSCGRTVRVPKANYGNSRYRSLLDFFVEWVVYGGAGGLLGFMLALLLISKVPLLGRAAGRKVLLGCTLVGLLAGGLGGETGINWLGRIIRNWEQR